jgi:ERCC4-related helicase
MRLISNTGADRVLDQLLGESASTELLDVATPKLSVFAFAELLCGLEKWRSGRMILPEPSLADLLGGPEERGRRNQLKGPAHARRCAEWLKQNAQLKVSPVPLPQSTYVVRNSDGHAAKAITGSCPLTLEGLGLVPGSRLNLIQCADSADEARVFAAWIESLWNGLPADNAAKDRIVAAMEALTASRAPSQVYHLVLYHLFKDLGGELDEDKIIKSATGIRETVVWKKLFRFQRDGVIGAIDKLERFGGCIIADSVGLGKTFEALAIIKYYELRNDRVLVLCPKRLRDNWTLYAANDRRNLLAADRFNYDVLNHTDLSRDKGTSGDIDLSYVNWGNYDLVVIDESHNFRNKKSPRKDGETRYDKLMRQIIKAGVKTRVLMLSATPVNNRLADLRNQLAFITEGQDDALADCQISSIDSTVQKAQIQFNRWLQLEEAERTSSKLMNMLGFDYFKLLDLLTIARSRKHIERYYGTAETGEFPDRLKPKNIKSDVDLAGQFPSIKDINTEIRRLKLSAYAPLRYVLQHKQSSYDQHYSQQVKGGQGLFRQLDREESLVHLLRVNMLKRMESSVHAFALTVQRQVADIEKLLSRIDAHEESVEEISIEDIDIEDATFESLLVGRKVKVLLADCDLHKWRQDLLEDHNRLETLLLVANAVVVEQDAKLADLKKVIADKIRNPINPNNRKVIVFTAFADTATYLYEALAPWAAREFSLHSALVTGSGRNKTTLNTIRTDLAGVLTAFSPRSKERGEEFANEGEIDLLFATDCISEGQNLQDCDCLINYDIHWNPVRIIQRFGRIDRIGSPNARIQLVNFWPNIELEEYIDLERRVSGRMVLLDISATGEENLIEHQSGDQMNDLEYRRKQLTKLQEAVIDIEDLSSGVSITDLTLNDFRMDLARVIHDEGDRLDSLPPGTFAVTTAADFGDSSIPPGVVFCLRAEADNAVRAIDPSYPLAPHYLVHIGEEGKTTLGYTQAKQILDLLKTQCMGRDLVDASAQGRFDRATQRGEKMGRYRDALQSAVTSIVGQSDERAVASLFLPGGTQALGGDAQSIDDFEVVAFLVILPSE